MRQGLRELLKLIVVCVSRVTHQGSRDIWAAGGVRGGGPSAHALGWGHLAGLQKPHVAK